MAKMVVICLESPLGGGQYLNTILLDPLQNKASSKRPASSRPQALVENRATNDAPVLPRSIGLTSMENKFYHQARSEAEHKMAMRAAWNHTTAEARTTRFQEN